MLFRNKDIDLKGKKSGEPEDKIDSDSFKSTDQMFERDGNGRTILHRLAVEQRENALSTVIKNLVEQNKDILKAKLEEKDKYGNTPLCLACIYDIQSKSALSAD